MRRREEEEIGREGRRDEKREGERKGIRKGEGEE